MSIWLSTALTAALLAAPDPSVETFEYTIQKGDSCAKIAKSVYGDRKHHEVIHQYNRWLGPTLPHHLEEGQVLVLPKSLPPALPDAEVTAARRKVEAKPPEKPEWKKASPGLDLYRGWRVNTQERASAEITFRDYSRIELRENTLVIIYGGSRTRARRKTTEATLDRGAMRTRLAAYAGKPKDSAVTVTTPSAVAEFDGGSTLVTVDPEGTSRVANHGEGKASVRSKKGGKRVKVGSKMGSKVKKGAKPTKPKPLPPTPQWDKRAPAIFVAPSGSGTVTGRWTPSDEAKSYRVEISRQADGREMVSSQTVPGTITEFEGKQLAPGDYYISIAAIDDDSFESPPSAPVKLSLVSVPLLTPGAAPLPALDDPDAAAAAGPTEVPRGTRLDVPRGLQCRVDDGELSRSPMLRDAGEHTVTCVTEDDVAVPGFTVVVVDYQIAAAAEASTAVRGKTALASFSVDASVPLPRRLWVEAPEGFLVAAPVKGIGLDEGTWSVRVHADRDAPDEASLFVMADAGGEKVQLGTVPLSVVDPKDVTPETKVEPEPAAEGRELHIVETGVLGGAIFPASDHDLYQERFARSLGYESLNVAAPTFGFRLGYYPIRWVGLELENTMAPTATRDTGEDSLLFAVRGHIVGQLPWRITPTLHVGGGALGANGGAALGRDIDAGFHFGGGVKFYITRWAMLRLDARDTMTEAFGGGLTHSPEVTLGFSAVLGRRSAKKE
ncbi:MAG: FecR domain-containing protein [Myxococcota bacterium]